MTPLSPQPHAVQTAHSAPYDGVITAFAGGQVSESGRPRDKTGAAGEERVMKQKNMAVERRQRATAEERAPTLLLTDVRRNQNTALRAALGGWMSQGGKCDYSGNHNSD